MYWEFLKHETPYPWDVRRFIDLENWQIQYITYCKRKDQEIQWDKKRWEIDYLGSYTDKDRALKSMSLIENKFKSNKKENKPIDLNDYFDPTPPIDRLTPEQRIDFDNLMRLKFGEKPKKSNNEQEQDEDFDSIEILKDSED